MAQKLRSEKTAYFLRAKGMAPLLAAAATCWGQRLAAGAQLEQQILLHRCGLRCALEQILQQRPSSAVCSHFSVMQKGGSMLHQLPALHCVWRSYSSQGHSLAAGCAHQQASRLRRHFRRSITP